MSPAFWQQIESDIPEISKNKKFSSGSKSLIYVNYACMTAGWKIIILCLVCFKLILNPIRNYSKSLESDNSFESDNSIKFQMSILRDCNTSVISAGAIVVFVAANIATVTEILKSDGEKYFQLQSGRSSLAKHRGAYFSAVYGFMKDLIAAPGPHENQEV